jgi:hypothetical protein
MSPAGATELGEQLADVEVPVSARAAELAERASGDLELWATPTEAGLFMASLALASGEQPPEDVDAEATLGPLETAGEPDELAHLALLRLEDGTDAVELVEDGLDRWIEAGADLLEERLSGADAVEAGEEIAEAIADLA